MALTGALTLGFRELTLEGAVMAVAFRKRDEGLQDKWKGKNDLIPVNEQQHTLDTIEREKRYIESQFTTQDEVDRYRTYREEWFRRAKEFDPGEVPLSVGIELVSTCNLNCTMCYTITEEFQSSVIGSQRMMPWPTVKAIIDEAAELGVASILFSWRGESSLYKSRHEGKVYRLPDVFKYAKEKGILERTVLTNGQLLDDEMCRALIDAEPSWINFSIDGLRDVYNKVRTPKNKEGDPTFDAFELVVSNIKRLVRLRDEAGKTKPQIRTNTIFPAIAKDPKAYLDFMKGIGVGWVTVNEILDFRGSANDGDELPEEAIIKDWACQYPFQRLMISANGIIVPCTGAHNEEEGLVLGRYLGSPAKSIQSTDGSLVTMAVREISIKEVWHSKKLKNIRHLHAEGQRETISSGCRNCRHGAVKHGVEWIPEDWNLDTMEWDGRHFRNG
jgi:sulfatase maturation enzyme AslB (radical SAM superfamily)